LRQRTRRGTVTSVLRRFAFAKASRARGEHDFPRMQLRVIYRE